MTCAWLSTIDRYISYWITVMFLYRCGGCARNQPYATAHLCSIQTVHCELNISNRYLHHAKYDDANLFTAPRYSNFNQLITVGLVVLVRSSTVVVLPEHNNRSELYIKRLCIKTQPFHIQATTIIFQTRNNIIKVTARAHTSATSRKRSFIRAGEKS